MQKFVVNKGKKGYDFSTLADSEAKCLDLAWQNRDQDDTESRRGEGPFSWWKAAQERWGHDKWYTVELSITQADKPVSKEDKAPAGVQEHGVIMRAIQGQDE